MKKNKINMLLIALVSFAVIACQENKQKFKIDNSITIIDKAMKQVVCIDTLLIDSTGIQRIEYLSDNGTCLVAKSQNLHSSLGLMGLRTEVYDSRNNLILEQIRNHDDLLWHQYEYKYNRQNKLIEKEGFSSGEIGHRIVYQYDENGYLKKEVVYRFGEKVDEKNY